MTELYHFVAAVISRWYALVTGTVFVLDQMLHWVWPKGKEWLDAKWPSSQRRPVEIAALITLLMVSSFEAYRGEVTKTAAAQKDADQAAGQVRQLEADLKQARAAVTPAPQPKITYKARSAPPVVGPLTAADLPVLYAIAIPGSPYLHGQVYPDSSRKTVPWEIWVTSKSAPIALMNTQRPENDQGILEFSGKIDGGSMSSGRAVNLWINPVDVKKFVHSGATFHIKLRADNGQEFEQDLPVKMLSFN